MRLITDTLEYCHLHMPHWNAMSVSGYHIREAGADAVQEVAFTLANAIAYVQAAIDAGQKVDDFAGQISFFFSAHNNLLEEVAKFRAARRLWARIMRLRFAAEKPRSWQLRFHTQTAGSTLTAQQPDNNVARVTLQALAAVLGGTQSLHTNSRDEALSLPTQESVQIALRSQQIIAHESGVTDTVDPLAGSYVVERWTNEIEAAAEDYIAKIDNMGGALAAIENGYIQREIQDSAYKQQLAVQNGDQVVVGVNEFVVEEKPALRLLVVDPSVADRQGLHLRSLRERRDNANVERTLKEVETAAKSGDNLMPSLMACVGASATLGEICGILREAFGEYRAPAFV